jgi:3-dehydroquinate synthase
VRVLWCRVDPAYPVAVGSREDSFVCETIERIHREGTWAPPAAVITDANVGPLYAPSLCALLERLGLEPRLVTVEPGEGSKSLDTYGRVCGELLEAGVSRRSPVVALGGGVVGDLAGFTAATFGRGLPWISFPTTLLAQVDSSIGGKVAVNLTAAKNMVGAFHQPRFVLSDPSCLETLPPREYRSGLAEVLKAALVGDPQLLSLLEDRVQAAPGDPPDLFEEILERAIAVKCDVVAEDERDTGRRHVLNLGHTFGHSLESATGYGRFLHGEAVAIGLSAALWLSSRMGLMDGEGVERVEAILTRWELPIRAEGLDSESVERIMGYDKKFAQGVPLFILLEDWGRPVIVRRPPEDLVRQAIRRMVGRGGDEA